MGREKLIKLTDEELAAEVRFELNERVKETKATDTGKVEFIKEIKCSECSISHVYTVDAIQIR